MKPILYPLIIFGLVACTTSSEARVKKSSPRKSFSHKNVHEQKHPPSSRVKEADAMGALDFWAMQRAYPNATIPDVGYAEAFESLAKTKQHSNEITTSDTWRAIGPHNIGGRTLALALNPKNPNTIYAGSASGGLWRSYTGGIGTEVWQFVATGFPVLGVSSIAISPSDSNTIYIGTGEVYGYQNSQNGLSVRTTRGSYGIGILKTTNGGATWTKSLDWSSNQKRGVWAVRINPKNPKTLWAATTEGTYKSLNAGATWTLVHTVHMAMDLVINPVDTNTVFVSCGDLGSAGAGIYRTTNGSTNWTKLSNGLPATFAGKAIFSMYEAHPNVLFVSIGNGSDVNGSDNQTWLCKSINNGDSWITVSTLDYARYQGWYAHFVGVNPADSSKLICAGVPLYRSTNAGVTLNDITGSVHVDFHAIVYHPTNPSILYLGSDGGVYRSADGGVSFEDCNDGYQTSQFYNGFSCAFTDSVLSIGGLQDNWSAVYEGSVTWRRVLYGDGCWTAIHPTNPDTMYGESQYLNLYKSDDRMQSFSPIGPSVNSITSFVAPFLLAPSRPRVMYAGSDKVFKSTDGGAGWVETNNANPLDGNPLLSLAVSFTNPDTVYAGTTPVNVRAGIFVTTNGGTSWKNITTSPTSGTLPDRYPVDIAVDPKTSRIVYVAFSGFGTSHLFKSSNAGESWSDIGGGLPDVPTSAVVVDPASSNYIYVGNDIGVYVSTNGGTSWQIFRDGMPDAAIIMDLTISRRNRALRAATYGNGVWERKLLTVTTDVARTSPERSQFGLEENYPNPFSSSTTIRFQTPAAGLVSLKMYDGLGREVVTLFDSQLDEGEHSVLFDRKKLSNGTYVLRLQAGEYVDERSIVITK